MRVDGSWSNHGASHISCMQPQKRQIPQIYLSTAAGGSLSARWISVLRTPKLKLQAPRFKVANGSRNISCATCLCLGFKDRVCGLVKRRLQGHLHHGRFKTLDPSPDIHHGCHRKASHHHVASINIWTCFKKTPTTILSYHSGLRRYFEIMLK